MAKISRHTLAATLAQKSMTGFDAADFSKEIAAYLVAERRTADLASLLRDIMQYRADHGTVEVIASSAHPLTATVRKDIEAQLHDLFPAAKKYIITEQLDPSAVGGVRLELANQQLDMTVRAKLNRFKQLTVSGRS